MDDWAIATAVDFDERTRIGAGSTVGTASSRRRRRRASAAARSATMTGDSRSQGSASSRGRAQPTTRRLLIGVGVAAAVFVALVVAGLLTIVRGAGGIPVVADVRAVTDGAAVVFSWDDPGGLRQGDTYVVTVDGRDWPPQREASLSVPADDAGQVCATVTVARDGKAGAPSAERCAEVAGQ